jgi:1,4-dihydroxy-2-naphthoate octaprenyltransferase
MTTTAAATPLKAWVLAARPRTLAAAAAPILVATSLVLFETGVARWEYSLLAFLCTLCLQVGTNFANDALDFLKGTDTQERLGPTRVSQAGMIDARAVLRAAWVAFGLAFLLGLPLVAAGGWPILAVGLTGILFGYAYTGGPYPLAYNGLGEVFVILYFGLAAVGGLYFLHAGEVSSRAWAAGLQIGLFATALIAINNLRDREGDERAGKRTLAVRFGEGFARGEIAFCLLAPLFLQVVLMKKPAELLPVAVCLVPAWKLARETARAPASRVFNLFLGRSARILLLFSVSYAASLALAAHL